MNERAARCILVVLLGLFVGLAAAYALTTPTLEAPDEIFHYEYIRALVNTGRPPVLQEGSGRGFGHHAPLYYAYGALVSAWVGDSDLRVWEKRGNPFFGYQFGEVGRDNKNLYIHPDDDALGSSETWLGVRVVRLASVVLGAITVWVIYRVGRDVFPARPEVAVGAAGFAAFVPEFLFISGAINDDNGAALFGALALWAMVRILGKGSAWRRCVLLGLALGLGWLSKLTVVALLPTAGVTLGLVAWRNRSWREFLRSGLIIIAVAGLLIGPWLIRQTVLYGDPTGTSREMSEWGLREAPLALADVSPDLYWLRTTFWGRLGHNQIPLSRWIYQLLDVVSLLAVLGLIRVAAANVLRASGPLQDRVLRLVTSVRGSQLAVLSAAMALSFGPMVVRRFLRPMPNFGRYLFPVLPSIAVMMFTGLSSWLPRHRRAQLALGLSLAMLGLGLGALICFLGPAYAQPPAYDVNAAPEPDHRLDWTYVEHEGPLARLVGYDLDHDVIEPGQTVEVTLYWRVLSTTDKNYVLFVQLLGQDGAKVGQRDTYPGLGHYPTSLWQPEEVIVDTIPVTVQPEATAPRRIRLDMGLYEKGDGRLPALDQAGHAVGRPIAGWLKLAPTKDVPPPMETVEYRLGQSVSLTGFDLSQPPGTLKVTLHWMCYSSLEQDYTVFAHLLSGDGSLVAQDDGPPSDGDYPTSLWAPGEAILDRREIDVGRLPSGTYRLRVGMYLLETGNRLPVTDGTSTRVPDDAILLTEVQLP